MHRLLSLAAMILIGGGWLASTASAEVVLDVYAGGAFHGSSEIESRVSGASASPIRASWGSKGEFGLRPSYWLEGDFRLPFVPGEKVVPLSWLGAALDVGYYGADTTGATGQSGQGLLELNLFPLTPLLMIRIPMGATEEQPGGRVQPYVAVGPSLTTTTVRGTLIRGSEITFDVGIDYRAGIKVQPWRRFGIYFEYRYTDVTIQIEDTVSDLYKTPITSSHLIVGASVVF
jgi:hypothetical protein